MAVVKFTEVETYNIHHFKCCGMNVGVPEKWDEARSKDGNRFHCPNCGAGWSYTPGPSESDKLKQELANVKRNLNWERDERSRLATEAEHQKRKAAAARGQVTKLKNRAANGVCPCCNRYFANLHRHMQTKHPEFQLETPE